MDLKQRLTLLRQQSGAAPLGEAAPLTPAGSALEQRLQRLRAPERPSPALSERTAEVAELLQGAWVSDGLIVVDRTVPLGQRHGRRLLAPVTAGQAPQPPLGQALPLEHTVFLDTETTGLAGGTGTLAFLVGMACIEGETLRLRQWFLTAFRGETALLEAVAAWIGQRQYLVTFNGKCFDAPLLTTRYRLARLRDPLVDLQHIDLFHPTRRAFQRQWPDCRLLTAEQRLLGFQRQDDLPSHLVPETWFAFVRRGVTRRLPALLHHNRWDLVSLVALLPALAEVFVRPHEHGADILAVARYWRSQGDEATALAHLQQHEAALDAAGLLELALCYKRQHCWEAALAIWQRLAARHCPQALEHLAKYHEHVRRDYPAALTYTCRLQALEPQNAAHAQRLARLSGKLGQGRAALEAYT
ncbi:MAG: ribonuclease H-like domain-containing protein [Candidatus Tectimicrobiota bacterium]